MKQQINEWDFDQLGKRTKEKLCAWYQGTYGKTVLPLLTIGEMIEMLDEKGVRLFISKADCHGAKVWTVDGALCNTDENHGRSLCDVLWHKLIQYI